MQQLAVRNGTLRPRRTTNIREQMETSGLAVATGGGVDYKLTRALAIRVAELSYRHSWAGATRGKKLLGQPETGYRTGASHGNLVKEIGASRLARASFQTRRSVSKPKLEMGRLPSPPNPYLIPSFSSVNPSLPPISSLRDSGAPSTPANRLRMPGFPITMRS